ncbi:hypothetical protein CEW82_10620 [Lactiplantibacillus pentosus]|nr:hypothetical protein CEW82_10620 [Lactiplantibacillus pentosus]
MKVYRRVQIIASGYLVVYLAALYSSTGVHTGFKLDSDQLIGYVTCGILAGLLGVSAVVKTGYSEKSARYYYYCVAGRCCFSHAIA